MDQQLFDQLAVTLAQCGNRRTLLHLAEGSRAALLAGLGLGDGAAAKRCATKRRANIQSSTARLSDEALPDRVQRAILADDRVSEYLNLAHIPDRLAKNDDRRLEATGHAAGRREV